MMRLPRATAANTRLNGDSNQHNTNASTHNAARRLHTILKSDKRDLMHCYATPPNSQSQCPSACLLAALFPAEAENKAKKGDKKLDFPRRRQGLARGFTTGGTCGAVVVVAQNTKQHSVWDPYPYYFLLFCCDSIRLKKIKRS